MTYAEIRAQLHSLTKEERQQLAEDLKTLAMFDDPEYRAEITRRMDDFEAGRNVVTSDELHRIFAARRGVPA